MNNPQGTAVLFNEVVSARIARLFGVPVASNSILEIHPPLAETLYFETPSGRRSVEPGLHYGSRVVISALEGRIYDCFPQNWHNRLRDDRVLTGGAILHLWLRNFDTTQSLYWRRSSERKFSVTLIDNGHCLGGPDWRIASELNSDELKIFPIEHLRFWLKRLKQISSIDLDSVMSSIPEGWGCNDKALQVGLLQWVQHRRMKLIAALNVATDERSTTAGFCAPKPFIHAPGYLA
jgi:hypothetical protein